MPVNFRDLETWQRGHTAELNIAELMTRLGWQVNPTYNYTGAEDNKAPRSLARGGPEYVLPDLQVWRSREMRWVEVKSKASANPRRVGNFLEHGIDKRHWDDYVAIDQTSGAPVYLCVFEENTGHILIATVAHLAASAPREGMLHGNRGSLMINWRRSSFTLFEASDFYPPDVESVAAPDVADQQESVIGQYLMFPEEGSPAVAPPQLFEESPRGYHP